MIWCVRLRCENDAQDKKRIVLKVSSIAYKLYSKLLKFLGTIRCIISVCKKVCVDTQVGLGTNFRRSDSKSLVHDKRRLSERQKRVKVQLPTLKAPFRWKTKTVKKKLRLNPLCLMEVFLRTPHRSCLHHAKKMYIYLISCFFQWNVFRRMLNSFSWEALTRL